MPGAPNRPPETGPAPPPPVAVAPDRRVLRRLAPSRVALLLDLWKGAPSKELVEPFDHAESAFAAGQLIEADKALDQLAVKFAEPRWPTMPVPFRDLRVAIPAPTPPHWDPDHGVEAAERDRRKVRRLADLQLALAKATAAFGARRGIPSDELVAASGRAESALAANGADDAFWTEIDSVWTSVRDRFPRPTGPGAKPAVPAATADAPS